MSVQVRLRPGMRVITLDHVGNVEIVEFDSERDEKGELIVTDHVRIANRDGTEAIYDDIADYLRGEPVDAQPVAAPPNDNIVRFPLREEVRDVA